MIADGEIILPTKAVAHGPIQAPLLATVITTTQDGATAEVVLTTEAADHPSDRDRLSDQVHPLVAVDHAVHSAVVVAGGGHSRGRN